MIERIRCVFALVYLVGVIACLGWESLRAHWWDPMRDELP